MDVTRREVLRRGSALPLIFGLSALGCRGGGEPDRGSSPPPPPAPPSPPTSSAPPPPRPQDPWYWSSTLETVRREEGSIGLLIRIPTDPGLAETLGGNVVDLAARGSLDERLLFLEATVVFATDAQIARWVPDSRGDAGLVVFDGKPSPKDAAALTPEVIRNTARLGAALAALIEGPHGFDLRAAAERRRALHEDPMAKAQFSDPAVAAYDWPLLALERRETKDETKRAALDRRLRAILDERLFGTGNHMPYGVEMSSEGGGCPKSEDPKVVIACGMAMPIPSSYEFLRYRSE